MPLALGPFRPLATKMSSGVVVYSGVAGSPVLSFRMPHSQL
jgi:hypothetical protein